MPYRDRTESRLLAELNDMCGDLKRYTFLNNFSFAGFILFVSMILMATAVGIFTSIIHFDATTACVLLTSVGTVGSIATLSFYVITNDWVSSVKKKLRGVEEEYELSTMSENE